MTHLRSVPQLRREKMNGRYVYFASSPALSQRQKKIREECIAFSSPEAAEIIREALRKVIFTVSDQITEEAFVTVLDHYTAALEEIRDRLRSGHND